MKTSPKILKLSWGLVSVEGQAMNFKDAKLYPGGVEEWDWREFGTQHEPGIHPDEVKDLIKKGADVVILSRGFNGKLSVPEITTRLLKERSIEFYILKIEEAVTLYNKLCENKQIGALFHTTC